MGGGAVIATLMFYMGVSIILQSSFPKGPYVIPFCCGVLSSMTNKTRRPKQDYLGDPG